MRGRGHHHDGTHDELNWREPRHRDKSNGRDDHRRIAREEVSIVKLNMLIFYRLNLCLQNTHHAGREGHYHSSHSSMRHSTSSEKHSYHRQSRDDDQSSYRARSVSPSPSIYRTVLIWPHRRGHAITQSALTCLPQSPAILLYVFRPFALTNRTLIDQGPSYVSFTSYKCLVAPAPL